MRAAVGVVRRPKWGYFVIPAVVSVVTMPITAIWFVLVGAVVAISGTAVALFDRTERGERKALRICAVAAGIYLGPAIYISLAVIV